MRAYIFRHGETEYKQGKVELEEACDLKPEGVRVVTESAMELATRFMAKENPPKIEIRSSPYGRCLHGAKIVRGVFNQNGLPCKIVVDDELEEVRNFSYPFLLQLHANSVVNPEGIPMARFFRGDHVHRLPQSARDRLPAEMLRKIDEMEPSSHVARRLHEVLGRLDPKNDTYVLKTHEGLTAGYINLFAEGENPELARGKYLALEGKGNEWKPLFAQKGAIIYEQLGHK